MKRAIVVALSVILALVVAAPIASGQSSSQSQNLGQLTVAQSNWAFSTSPSPLEGSYEGGAQCNGEVDGVFFLAGALEGSRVDRTCTVPANMPILFSPFNYLCSNEVFPTDPVPLDTACATPITSSVIDPPSSFYARVDGMDANQQRIASGLFQWTIAVDNPRVGVQAGTYEAAQDGLWVYLENGLNKGKHTVQFGGTFKDTLLGDFKGTKVTYKLTAK